MKRQDLYKSSIQNELMPNGFYRQYGILSNTNGFVPRPREDVSESSHTRCWDTPVLSCLEAVTLLNTARDCFKTSSELTFYRHFVSLESRAQVFISLVILTLLMLSSSTSFLFFIILDTNMYQFLLPTLLLFGCTV